MFTVSKSKLISRIGYYGLFIIVFLVTYLFYEFSNVISGSIMIVYSIVQYVLVSKKNNTLLDLKSVFLLTWCLTLGLAMLRLLGYQFEWGDNFFIAQFLGCLTIIVSIDIGHLLVKTKRKLEVINLGAYKNSTFQVKTYYFVLLCTIIAIICFVLNYLTVGFIPLFEESATAYIRNSSKFLTIEVGMAPVSGVAYYCITRDGISKKRKIIMWGCIALNMLIFPILNLSRGNMVANVCMFLPAFFFCTKDIKKSLFRIGLVAIVVFMVLTAQRDFESSYAALQISSQFANNESIMMIYAYLTGAHDNFALNILSFDEFTYGLRMFNIFNEILDIESISLILQQSELLWVNSFLNTQDMFGFFYYDIGYLGIFLWSLIWGTIWGVTEKKARVNPSPISYIMLGISFYCVAFAFFSSKTGFVTVMWYGMAYLGSIFMKIKQKGKLNGTN